MRFFRNNWHWTLATVICLIVGSVLVVERGQQETAEIGLITPDTADQTPPGELAGLIWYDSPEEAIGYALEELRSNVETDEACLRTKTDVARLHCCFRFCISTIRRL